MHIGLFEDQGSHYRKTGYPIAGEEDSVRDVGEDYISVSGTIAYDDVFGRSHKMSFSQYSYSLKDDGHLRGSGFSEPDPHDQKFRK